MLPRILAIVALTILFTAPASASPIKVTIGDKDGFGLGLAPGEELPCVTADTPCLSPIQDWRSPAEQAALNGAQLTDLYSALYDGPELDCPVSCSPNGPTGTIVFPFAGVLGTGSITMFLGDFQSSLFNPMLATINGVPVAFFYDQGYRQTSVETIQLTPEMIAAANLDGEVRLFLDHRKFRDQPPGPTMGSYDYVAFDYLELNGDAMPSPVPEPGTLTLLGGGLAALAARRRKKRLARNAR